MSEDYKISGLVDLFVCLFVCLYLLVSVTKVTLSYGSVSVVMFSCR